MNVVNTTQNVRASGLSKLGANTNDFFHSSRTTAAVTIRAVASNTSTIKKYNTRTRTTFSWAAPPRPNL